MKYELIPAGSLYRIVAVRDIPKRKVLAGDQGGLVTGPDVLSQDDGDTSWIEPTAFVYDSHVNTNSLVSGYSTVKNSYVNGSVVENSRLTTTFLNGARIERDSNLVSATIDRSVIRATEITGARVTGGSAFDSTIDQGAVLLYSDLRKANIGRNALIENSIMIHSDAEREAIVSSAHLNYSTISTGARVYDVKLHSVNEIAPYSSLHYIPHKLSGPYALFFVPVISSVGDRAVFYWTPDGEGQIVIGCWRGTPQELHALADSPQWPSNATDATRAQHAPLLHAYASLCEAWRDVHWGPVGHPDGSDQ